MPLFRMSDGQFGIDGGQQVFTAAWAQHTSLSAQSHSRKSGVARDDDVTRAQSGNHGIVGGIRPGSNLECLHAGPSLVSGKILRPVRDQHYRQRP